MSRYFQSIHLSHRFNEPVRPPMFSDEDIARIAGTGDDAAPKRVLLNTINMNLRNAFDGGYRVEGTKLAWMQTTRCHTGDMLMDLAQGGTLEGLQIVAGYTDAQSKIQKIREMPLHVVKHK